MVYFVYRRIDWPHMLQLGLATTHTSKLEQLKQFS